jgi:tetratricopeptide (TPR) repeat protein
MSSSFPVVSTNPGPESTRRLDSWKEIAAFFNRGERTVKRWESERGLPVHRVPGNGRSAVFAYSHELAAWLEGRDQELANEEAAPVATLQTETEIASSDENASQDARAQAPSTPAKTSFPTRLAATIVLLVIATGIVGYLTLRHARSGRTVFARQWPNHEAQELYLKGRYYWNRRTPEDLNTAIDYFTQAIVKDPSDTEAYVGLADCYNLLREFGAMPAGEAYTRALSAAQRAVQLDDSSAEAHASLAFSTFWWSWRGATAEREFRRALQLDPNLVRAHHWYGTFSLALHRYPEALVEIEKAQRLQPSASTILADKGFLLSVSGHPDEGLALLEQLASSEPSLSSTHDYLGRLFWQQANYGKALSEWRQSAELRHDQDALAVLEAGERGLAANGLRGLYESELIVQKEIVDRGAGSAYALASTYAALGKKQEAMLYLQMSFDRHESGVLLAYPPIPEMNNDPAYRALIARVNQLLAQ